MFDDKSRRFKNEYVSLKPVGVEKYEPFVGAKFVDELVRLSRPLRSKVWANVNSTYIGGGVAEMLQSVVPLARGLGIDCRWFVIEGSDEFFNVTKKFHNLLQGARQSISLEEVFHAYLDTINENTRSSSIVGDLVTVHDPQPAALIMYGNIYGHILWRCHIDTSSASRRIWRFLLPYINQYDGAIFTDKSFVKDGLQVPVYEQSPSIDPLREKNRLVSRKEAHKTLEGLFSANDIDHQRPIIAAVSRYDIHKNQKTIIRAFKLLKKKIVKGIDPLLIIVGNSATDDPEGSKVFDQIEEERAGDKDIHLFINVENNDRVVGSLMSVADCFVHISTKEGFGLVVSEALWQGTPVIASRVGGIIRQVIHGENGFLIEPLDAVSCAGFMKQILEDKSLRQKLSRQAHKHVRSNFLLPQMLKKDILLMRYYLEIDKKVPDFRLNPLTYREARQALFGRKSSPFSKVEVWEKIKGNGK